MSAPNTGTSTGKARPVGIVVVAHGNLAVEMVRAAKSVLGSFPALAAVPVEGADSRDRTKKKILKAIKEVNRGAGIIILTDLMGGTATNLSLEAARAMRAQVLAGANLPILIKLATLRTGDPKTLARSLRRYGQRQIVEASALLDRKVDRGRGRQR